MEKYKAQQIYTLKQAVEKLKKYCAYQERCHQEVRNKFYEIGLRDSEIEEGICILIEENYLNEERFAQAYSRGKFRIKKWGKYKIIQGLRSKGISEPCIKKSLAEIDPQEYLATYNELVEKKGKNYAISKGFEGNL